MDEYIQTICDKYKYSPELSNFLKSLVPAMVTYYGEEHGDVILEALTNCEIHIQDKDENPKDYLNSYFGTDKEWKMPSLSGAFYHNEISVRDERVSAKPIVYIKTVFFRQYKPFDFEDDSKANILVHELCHLVKGYGKTKMENGRIFDSTGLMRDVYRYDAKTGKIEEDETQRLGIEEAINEVDATKIMEIMTGRPQEIRGYKAAGNAALELIAHGDIREVIKNSQFNGDDSWADYLGNENSNMLSENFDVLVKSMYVSYADINTLEKIAEIKRRMTVARSNISAFSQNYVGERAFSDERQSFKK